MMRNDPFSFLRFKQSLQLYSFILFISLFSTTSCIKTECNDLDGTCNPFLAFLLYNPNLPTIQISIGSNASHSCIKFADGSVRCWGGATNGKLGYNSTISVGDGIGLSIINAGDVSTGGEVANISAGLGHTCAVMTNSEVRCWGLGTDGRTGYNNINLIGDGIGQSILQAGVVPIGGSVSQISAYNSHTCAVLNNGSVRCWGAGAVGQLGYNNPNRVGDGIGASINTAGDVPVGEKVTQIGTGNAHTCALLVTGNVRCWGSGTLGKLGYSNTTTIGNGGTSIIAAGDVPVGGTVKQIAVGSNHACALLETGVVRCWGSGGGGRLGYNNLTAIGDSGPTSIVNTGDVQVGGTVTQIAAGESGTCVVLSTGAVRCWGLGTSGQLGYDNMLSIADGGGVTILSAGDIPLTGLGNVKQIEMGGLHSCALFTDDSVRCWGSSIVGRLGHNNTNSIGDGVGLSIINAGIVPVK